ncbi:MAG TPA: cyclase family protein [Blastocatellia bacterium]|nr:cyclase family protein [Blastocatellia bacterium]
MKKAALLAIIVCLSYGCSARQEITQQDILHSGSWVDLSHDFSADTVYWPTAEPFKLTIVAAGKTDAGYYYSANQFSASEHGGTHIDAPVHFAESGDSVDRIPLDRLIGPAVKLDVSAKAKGDRDYLVSVADLETWETKNGKIPDDSIVLLQTGWSDHWNDRIKYLGTDKRGPEAVAELHFPGLAPDAARWLTENRKIKAIGLDTASIDYGQSTLFESHRTLMAQNIPAFENLNNLDRLPVKIAMVIAMPMKIRGGSGGPLRIIALVERPREQ